jgi:hypothetical protein
MIICEQWHTIIITQDAKQQLTCELKFLFQDLQRPLPSTLVIFLFAYSAIMAGSNGVAFNSLCCVALACALMIGVDGVMSATAFVAKFWSGGQVKISSSI